MALMKELEFQGTMRPLPNPKDADLFFGNLPASVEYAVAAMKSDNPDEVRLWGARSLTAINPYLSYSLEFSRRKKLITDERMDEIRKSVNDPLPEVQQIAKWILGDQ